MTFFRTTTLLPANARNSKLMVPGSGTVVVDDDVYAMKGCPVVVLKIAVPPFTLAVAAYTKLVTPAVYGVALI